jgi:hypothetical protein
VQQAMQSVGWSEIFDLGNFEQGQLRMTGCQKQSIRFDPQSVYLPIGEICGAPHAANALREERYWRERRATSLECLQQWRQNTFFACKNYEQLSLFPNESQRAAVNLAMIDSSPLNPHRNAYLRCGNSVATSVCNEIAPRASKIAYDREVLLTFGGNEARVDILAASANSAFVRFIRRTDQTPFYQRIRVAKDACGNGARMCIYAWSIDEKNGTERFLNFRTLPPESIALEKNSMSPDPCISIAHCDPIIEYNDMMTTPISLLVSPLGSSYTFEPSTDGYENAKVLTTGVYCQTDESVIADAMRAAHGEHKSDCPHVQYFDQNVHDVENGNRIASAEEIEKRCGIKFWVQGLLHLIILTASMGTGKTKFVIDHIRANPKKRYLVISPRRSLTDDHAERMREANSDLFQAIQTSGIENVLHYRDAFLDAKTVNGCRVLCICSQSLHRIPQECHKNFDMLVFDEVNAAARDNTKKFARDRFDANDTALWQLLRCVNVALYMDADYNPLHSLWHPLRLVNGMRRVNVTRLHNAKHNLVTEQKRVAEFSSNQTAFETKMREKCEAGQRFAVFCASKRRCKTWKVMLAKCTNADGSQLRVLAVADGEMEIKKLSEYILQNDIQVLLYTTKISMGFDLSAR